MSDHEAKQATPHATLLAELLDSRVPKSEREHAASREIERLTAELETERMRLAACGVVALANTEQSAAKEREMLPEYRSASLAEPKLGELMREQRNSRIVAGAYPDGNPNAGAIMAQTSQAEPKREPLPGLAPTHRCPACGALWRQCDDASWNLRSASCCGLCDAGRVELVRLLDEPKREPLSDEQIDEIGDPFGYFQYGDAQGDKRRAFARAVERAHRIGGSDAE